MFCVIHVAADTVITKIAQQLAFEGREVDCGVTTTVPFLQFSD